MLNFNAVYLLKELLLGRIQALNTPENLKYVPWFSLKFFSDAGFKSLVGPIDNLKSGYSTNVLCRYLSLGKSATYSEEKGIWVLPPTVKQVATTWVTKQGIYVATAQEQVSFYFQIW